MKSVILNKEKLTGFNVNATAPVGAIIMWASDNLPVGWLKCDHTELLIADYPKLYDRLKDIPQCQSENEGYFYTPDFRDREPQGANGNIGELIEAGLPNITGSFMNAQDSVFGWQANNSEAKSGAFYTKSTTTQVNYAAHSDVEGIKEFGFDASKSNEIYGNSDTVQPPAFAIHFIIKATQTSDSLDEIIDDSKTDIGHTWSGKKISEEIASANTYSTEEKVVGTWIDGKPIYRKVINNLSLNCQNRWETLGVIPNIEQVMSIKGLGNGNGGSKAFASNIYAEVKSGFSVSIFGNGTYDLFLSTKTIIIEYTKTTD